MAKFTKSPALEGVAPRRVLPPPALCGFLLLLAVVFWVSYAAGSAAGPVAPGIHGTGSAGTGIGPDHGSDGDVGHMPGMHGGGE